MAKALHRWITWTPRILAILFALFVSMFALDVFTEGPGVEEIAFALFMHLIPTFLLLAITALAWRWEWIGAVGFGFLGLLYIVWAWGQFHISAYIFIAGPLLLIAVLFSLAWFLKRRAKEEVGAAG